MIPVTIFRQDVAVFGSAARGSRLPALVAGGARRCRDDNEKIAADAQSRRHRDADLRSIDWSGIAALVLAPGVPLTHPKPHWTRRAGARKAERRNHRRHRTVLPRTRAPRAPSAPFVAITGTNGKSTTTALIAHHAAQRRARRADRRQYRRCRSWRSSRRAPGRVYVRRSAPPTRSTSRLRSTPTVGILLNVSPDHLDRHGTMENYAAHQERLVPAAASGGTAVIGVDDDYTRAAADRIERAGKTGASGCRQRRRCATAIMPRARASCARDGGKAHAVAQLAGIGSLRGAHNAQNAAAPSPPALRSALDLAAIQKGLTTFPGLAHRMEQVGPAIGQRAVRQRFQGDQCRFRRQGAGELPRHFLDRRRQAEDGRHRRARRILPAHPQGLSDRRGGAGISPRRSRARCLTRSPATARRAVDARGARCRSVSGLTEPVVLLSPACARFDQYRNFEVRGEAFRELVRALPGVAHGALPA